MKMLNKYQKVLEKLLPWGTRRRYYYELGLKGIRVIRNEGLISFYRKARYKIAVLRLNKAPKTQGRSPNNNAQRVLKNPPVISEETKELCIFENKKFFWTVERYSTVAKQPSSSRVVDIIVCVGGNPELLYRCVNAIQKYTDPNLYGLNLVVHEEDVRAIGSDIKRRANLVTHSMEIFNFAKANNMVINRCTGDVVLLNDDTEVTEGWLEKLKQDSKGMALTGAHTGFECSGNPDMWGEGPCRITWNPINMFCVYLPRRILDTVGVLDEEYCYYGGEDVDYSCRTLQHGFPLIVSSAFVQHEGNKSFKEQKND